MSLGKLAIKAAASQTSSEKTLIDTFCTGDRDTDLSLKLLESSFESLSSALQQAQKIESATNIHNFVRPPKHLARLPHLSSKFSVLSLKFSLVIVVSVQQIVVIHSMKQVFGRLTTKSLHLIKLTCLCKVSSLADVHILSPKVLIMSVLNHVVIISMTTVSNKTQTVLDLVVKAELLLRTVLI